MSYGRPATWTLLHFYTLRFDSAVARSTPPCPSRPAKLGALCLGHRHDSLNPLSDMFHAMHVVLRLIATPLARQQQGSRQWKLMQAVSFRSHATLHNHKRGAKAF